MSGNSRQIAYWNEVAGPKWVRIQGAMEARLVGVEDLLLARALPAAGEHVLEIGCGTGTTTARLAAAVGDAGQVVAVDVSRPMLEVARRGSQQRNVRFIETDAATEMFEPIFDLVTSRFGIMFFEDPVAAFTNLRRGLKPAGRLVCVAWAPIGDNPHWSVPLGRVIARLGAPKPRPPHAPGPLAFDDVGYVADILAKSGFRDGAIEAVPVTLIGRSLEDEAGIAAIMGPAGALLDEKGADEATRGELRAGFLADLPDYSDPQGNVPAMVHVITASA